jgi:hypothetical protein
VTCTVRDHELDLGQTWRYSRCLACQERFKTVESIVLYLKPCLNDDFPTIDPNSNMGRYVKKQRDAASKLARSQQDTRLTRCS